MSISASQFFGIAIVLATLLGAFVVHLAARDKRLEAATKTEPGSFPVSAKFILILLGSAMFLGLLVWIFNSNEGPASATAGFGAVAGLILLGLAAFIGIMNVLSLTASRIGMLDGRQPFGLPDGSVRAILTIAFIVLVGVLSAFLITGHQNRNPFHAEGMRVAGNIDLEQANRIAGEMRTQLGADALVVVREARDDKNAVVAGKFDLRVHPKLDNRMADDIAKQTLTMISTILAAMIGFYFAARSGSEGGDPAVVRRAEAKARLTELVTKSGMREALEAADLAIKAKRETIDPAASAAVNGPIEKATIPLEQLRGAFGKRFLAVEETLNSPAATLADTENAILEINKLRDEVAKLISETKKLTV